ncbi:hypothetical protein BRADI_1g07635v3 [Brachypodium distachyon]|uniref:Uncharacterized protein n=1 Tax=Brachypodium distachyon TaxID=15368 RepID=A0A0Q3KPJ6_BRADI|nr:hypothetical protein BRADI_1g07635v3 [Brachypodium distachyon]
MLSHASLTPFLPSPVASPSPAGLCLHGLPYHPGASTLAAAGSVHYAVRSVLSATTGSGLSATGAGLAATGFFARGSATQGREAGAQQEGRWTSAAAATREKMRRHGGEEKTSRDERRRAGEENEGRGDSGTSSFAAWVDSKKMQGHFCKKSGLAGLFGTEGIGSWTQFWVEYNLPA